MSGFAVYTVAELLDLKPPSWLIADTVPEQGLIALYGAPGDGKSFIALDMALCVAAGIPWQGHDTQKAYVVYVSAEGG
jgi:RecA-family ATPase